MISKNIFIVNCEVSRFEDYFSRKKNSDIVNYFEIKKRLTNNDVFKTPPSRDIIEFHMMKRLNSFSRCKKSEFLYFYTDSISEDLIKNLKNIFSSCNFPVNFHLLQEEGSNFPKYQDEFVSVQYLETNDTD